MQYDPHCLSSWFCLIILYLCNYFNSRGRWMWIFKPTLHYRWTFQTLWARETRSSSPSIQRYTTSINKNLQDCVFRISALPPKSTSCTCCSPHSFIKWWFMFYFFQSTLPNFKQNEFSVVRQHEEFIWLHDSFVENEEYAGYIVSTVKCFAYYSISLVM